MELNITPGDWHWHDTFGRKDGLGPTTPGRNLLGEEPRIGQVSHNSYVVSDDQGFVVARVSNALVTMSSERSEANSKMMANSPKLYRALERIAGAAATVEALTQDLRLPSDVSEALVTLWEASRAAEGALALARHPIAVLCSQAPPAGA